MKELIKEVIEIGHKPIFFLASFALIKSLTHPESRSIKSTIFVFATGIPIGLLAYFIATEWGIGEYTSTGISCVALLLSERIVWAIMNIDVDDVITKSIKKWLKK